jgi:hypothetical protein
MDTSRIEGFRWRMGLTNLVVKDCNGRSGGLTVFWRRGVEFHLRALSRLYIDGDVTEKDGFKWRFTDFYGQDQIIENYHGELSVLSMHQEGIHGCVWEILMKFY